METQQSQQCGNCRFYAVRNETTGTCRRHPPVAGLDWWQRFPATLADDWCGEYERAIPPAAPQSEKERAERIARAERNYQPRVAAPPHRAVLPNPLRPASDIEPLPPAEARVA